MLYSRLSTSDGLTSPSSVTVWHRISRRR